MKKQFFTVVAMSLLTVASYANMGLNQSVSEAQVKAVIEQTSGSLSSVASSALATTSGLAAAFSTAMSSKEEMGKFAGQVGRAVKNNPAFLNNVNEINKKLAALTKGDLKDLKGGKEVALQQLSLQLAAIEAFAEAPTATANGVNTDGYYKFTYGDKSLDVLTASELDTPEKKADVLAGVTSLLAGGQLTLALTQAGGFNEAQLKNASKFLALFVEKSNGVKNGSLLANAWAALTDYKGSAQAALDFAKALVNCGPRRTGGVK